MPYVPPKYPGAIPTAGDLPDRTDDVDWIYAARYNEIKKELRAALTELGALPKGGHADVKTRLDVQQHIIADDDGDSYEDVEKTADVDEAVTYLKNVLVRKFHDDGILDLPKQSRARAYRSASDQTIATATEVKIELDAETYDEHNEFDSDTNYRFTATKTGWYQVHGSIGYKISLVDNRFTTMLYKNGVAFAASSYTTAIADYHVFPVSDVVYLSVNDYVELIAYQDSGGNASARNRTQDTFLSIHKLS